MQAASVPALKARPGCMYYITRVGRNQRIFVVGGMIRSVMYRCTAISNVQQQYPEPMYRIYMYRAYQRRFNQSVSVGVVHWCCTTTTLYALVLLLLLLVAAAVWHVVLVDMIHTTSTK